MRRLLTQSTGSLHKSMHHATFISFPTKTKFLKIDETAENGNGAGRFP